MSASPLLDLRPGEPQRHRNLTVFPLFAEGTGTLSCTVLAEALAAGDVTIKEVGEGSVPALFARNAGDADVLLLDGEQLIGARQNRITNRSILLAAGSEIRIPVSCMEQGRWHFVSEEFTPRSRPMQASATVRRRARDVEAMYASEPDHAGPEILAAAQSEVWGTIAEASRRLGVRSPTGAMSEMYDSRQSDLDEWAAHFPPLPDQVGLLAILGGAPLGLDAIGDPRVFARLHGRLLGGYLMDALVDGGETPGEPTPGAAAEFLDRVGAAMRGRAPTVGKGTYRLLSGDVVGGELEDDSRLIHLSAFPGLAHGREDGSDQAAGPIGRPSRRRMGHLRGPAADDA